MPASKLPQHQPDSNGDPQIRATCLFGCLSLCLYMSACSQRQGQSANASANSTRTNEMALESKVDLGVLTQGETMSFRQWLTNQSDREIEIGRAVPSCDCLSVRFGKLRLDAKAKVLAEFRYDGTKEPDFVGALGIEVVVTDNRKQEVGKLSVAVEVIRPAAEKPSSDRNL